MALQWYPGHMTKARRELFELMPTQHLVIEVLDARLPRACTNPVIAELRGDKPCIKVLTKSDLADPVATRAWIDHFQADPRVAAFAAMPAAASATRKRIAELAAKLGLRARPDRPIKALIAGVPNVGKSTLINQLMDRPVAKTGDKPAVTKVQQRVVLRTGMVVHDSPGIMWPRIEDERGALRLAFAGSIPDTAIDYLTVALFGAQLILERYPELAVARYKLPEVPATPEALIAEIARRRGGLRPGNTVDLHKGSEVLVHEFRQGLIGRISLELP
jgi:ribosome biogenesis GTPase A